MVENLQICNLWTGSPTKFADLQFAICSAIKRNLRICDCGLSLRICEFKKNCMATPWQICHWCQQWCTLSCEYFREFSNKFKPALIGYSGAWGKLIHEKNMKSTISWHCPFKLPFACTKLYKVKTADSRCHSWPTGNYKNRRNFYERPKVLAPTVCPRTEST